jgi:hypothetical protein
MLVLADYSGKQGKHTGSGKHAGPSRLIHHKGKKFAALLAGAPHWQRPHE